MQIDEANALIVCNIRFIPRLGALTRTASRLDRCSIPQETLAHEWSKIPCLGFSLSSKYCSQLRTLLDDQPRRLMRVFAQHPTFARDNISAPRGNPSSIAYSFHSTHFEHFSSLARHSLMRRWDGHDVMMNRVGMVHSQPCNEVPCTEHTTYLSTEQHLR